MSNINEVITGIRNKNYALITFLLIFFSFFGIIWLVLLDVTAGYLYFVLLIGFFTLWGLARIFIKEEDRKFYLSLPFSRNNGVGALRFFLGFTIPFILKGILSIFAISFSIIPPLLVFNAVQSGQQSFAALSTQQSAFFSLFNIVIVAGAWEELILAPLLILPAIIFGYAIVLAINSLFKKSIKTNSIYTKVGVYTFAFIVSLVFFAILHSFNPSYTTTTQFMVAAGFRLLMNILMFFFLGIEFTIGIHMANNFLYLGVSSLFKAMYSNFLGTLAILFVFLIIFIFAIAELRDIITSNNMFARFKRIFSMKS